MLFTGLYIYIIYIVTVFVNIYRAVMPTLYIRIIYNRYILFAHKNSTAFAMLFCW